MDIRDELIFDFSIHIPRLFICGGMLIIDNVKRIVSCSETEIIVHNSSCYTSVQGQRISIRELGEERMTIKGELESIRFFETL